MGAYCCMCIRINILPHMQCIAYMQYSIWSYRIKSQMMVNLALHGVLASFISHDHIHGLTWSYISIYTAHAYVGEASSS